MNRLSLIDEKLSHRMGQVALKMEPMGAGDPACDNLETTIRDAAPAALQGLEPAAAGSTFQSLRCKDALSEATFLNRGNSAARVISRFGSALQRVFQRCDMLESLEIRAPERLSN